MPTKVKDLQGQVKSKEKEVLDMYRKLKDCLNGISMPSKEENEYSLNIVGKRYNINNLKFKDIYLICFKLKRRRKRMGTEMGSYFAN